MSDIDGPDRRDQNKTAAAASAAQEKAAQGTEVVTEHASSVAGTAKQQAAGVADEARSQARDLTGQVRGQLRDQAHSQTHSLAANLQQVSDDLKEMSSNARSGSAAAKAVRQVADGSGRVASRLESRGPEGLLSDLGDFARRRPGVFLAGAALAGFAVARAGKGVQAAGSGSDGGGRSASGAEPSGADRPAEHLAPAGVASGDTRSESSRAGFGQPDPLDTYEQSQPPHRTPGSAGGDSGPVTPHTPPAYPRSRDDGAPPVQGS
ncbi:hypothetical protein AB0903_13380 [Streptomyces sp. NPDC048389]|uniref:hypothetical protein n=1 Tax=Streptomyces sp. NPDC048389 TaxID=3154622 RepID=UPI003452FE31